MIMIRIQMRVLKARQSRVKMRSQMIQIIVKVNL